MIGGGNNIIIATNTAELIANGLIPKGVWYGMEFE
jgi:hypothetical protein